MRLISLCSAVPLLQGVSKKRRILVKIIFWNHHFYCEGERLVGSGTENQKAPIWWFLKASPLLDGTLSIFILMAKEKYFCKLEDLKKVSNQLIISMSWAGIVKTNQANSINWLIYNREWRISSAVLNNIERLTLITKIGSC